MRSQSTNLALGAVVGIFLLSLFPLFYSGSWRVHHRVPAVQQEAVKQSPPVYRLFEETPLYQREQLPKFVGEDIFHSPGHQNPAKAPPVPSTDHPTSPLSLRSLHNLDRRDALRCDNGPCVDGSCCSKDEICGFGPTYCGIPEDRTNCTSQCEATAMCGEYSENANMPCGMKLCCSAMGWCGTTGDYCGNADPIRNTLPCQAGYGSCAVTGPPPCPAGGKSIEGRKIGYYQSWNVRDRKCDKVEPQQLNTTGYTHLYYAFASIDPKTFTVTPMHPDDEQRMKDFTAMTKSRGLQAWIAIGGFDFSNKNVATHKTWSDIVLTKANRKIFIDSVLVYMNTHGFQGVDLDWEYPGDEDRGGRKLNDTIGFSALLKEMRASYGTSIGISLTLAPDYWYLRWFDAKAMEPYVDFFGFMAYDLHGSWDSDVKALGKVVRGQADIREISTDIVPLWFDGLDPKKINFGLAMYGRGYTLADPNCHDLLCPFTNASRPAQCTNFEGVMSLVEIQRLIKERNLTPKSLPDSMMKQITWDDQWIGYDDAETMAQKTAWANDRCFGGTMVWSIDFQVEGGGGSEENIPVIYLAPEVYGPGPGSPNVPVPVPVSAQCKGPCVLVLPPRTLPSATTISIPPYTTSLEVGTGTSKTTTTIVVIIAPITTTEMQYSNVNISSGETARTIIPIGSLNLPPATTTVTGPGGVIQTRTLVLPPWPLITNGPPGSWTPTTGPGLPWPPVFPVQRPPPIPFPTIPSHPKPTFAFPNLPDPPKVVWPPSFSFSFVDVDVPDLGIDLDGTGPKYRSSCKLWFFGICIKWADVNVHIGGWDWDFPVGIWGPGKFPFDRITLPPGFTLHGELPPWPQITIAPGGQPAFPPKPADCTPVEASICGTVTSFSTTVSNQITKTTSTQVKATCATITGCDLKDSDVTTTVKVCTLPQRRAAEATGAPLLEARADSSVFACDQDGDDGIIWPNDYTYSAQIRIRELLDERDSVLEREKKRNGFTEIRANALDFTAFYYVNNLGPTAKEYFASDEVKEVLRVYYWEQDTAARLAGTTPPWKRDDEIVAPNLPDIDANITLSNESSYSLLDKRTETHLLGPWHLSQVSIPKDVSWDVDNGVHQPSQDKYAYFFDDSQGEGQTIYLMEEAVVESFGEFSNIQVRTLPVGSFGGIVTTNPLHGTLVGSYAVGKSVGIARKAELVVAPTPGKLSTNWPTERLLEALVLIVNDIEEKAKPEDSTVVNMSFGVSPGVQEDGFWNIMVRLMDSISDKYGTVWVASAGNSLPGTTAGDLDRYPALFKKYLGTVIVVGASQRDGSHWPRSKGRQQSDIYAPGAGLPWPADANLGALPPTLAGDWQDLAGASLAAPLVAGLVAYFRAYSIASGSATISALEAIDGVIGLGRPIKFTAGTSSDAPDVIYNGGEPNDGSPCGDNAPPGSKMRARGRALLSRQSNDACPLPGAGDPRGPPVTFTQGPPSPLCTANCGHLCTGFYCVPRPTGTPPDFPQPAPTEQPTYKIGIGYILYPPPEPNIAFFSMVVFDCGTGGDIDVCAKPTYISGTYMADHYPEYEDIGPFDVKGRGGAPSVSCTHVFPHSQEIGTMTCDGIVRDCQHISSAELCGANHMDKMFECSWS